MFGEYLNVPTFYLENNPYSSEINWLKELIQLNNTPYNIKKLASKILKEISPKNKIGTDYKYLPIKKDDFQIPKKELILVRNEIGKVSGYRFYRESFTWFDENLLSNSEYSKNLELICMCISFEPYLYDRISNVLTDVQIKIETFILSVIFGISDSNNKNFEFNNLFYDWSKNKKDIIHLFFIVFKDHKLLELINTKNNILLNLLEFSKEENSTLNYILYKLTFYFPINEFRISNLNLKNKILEKLNNYSNSSGLTNPLKTKIKIFRHFIASLPSEKTFELLLNSIVTEYEKVIDENFHNDNLYADKQIIKSQLNEIGRKIFLNLEYDEQKILILKYSEGLINFIENILSFTNKFPEFYLNNSDLKNLKFNTDSLSSLFDKYLNAIYDNDEIKYFNKIIDILENIYTQFISVNSQIFKIFSHFNTTDLFALIINNNSNNIKITGNVFSSNEIIAINIPNQYTDQIFREVFNNLRHSDGNVSINYVKEFNFINIEFVNIINDSSKKGGSNGTRLLNNLNNKLYKSSYTFEPKNNFFIQKFKFEIV